MPCVVCPCFLPLPVSSASIWAAHVNRALTHILMLMLPTLTIPPHKKHAGQAPATLAAHKMHLLTPCCPMLRPAQCVWQRPLSEASGITQATTSLRPTSPCVWGSAGAWRARRTRACSLLCHPQRHGCICTPPWLGSCCLPPLDWALPCPSSLLMPTAPAWGRPCWPILDHRQ